MIASGTDPYKWRLSLNNYLHLNANSTWENNLPALLQFVRKYSNNKNTEWENTVQNVLPEHADYDDCLSKWQIGKRAIKMIPSTQRLLPHSTPPLLTQSSL